MRATIRPEDRFVSKGDRGCQLIVIKRLFLFQVAEFVRCDWIRHPKEQLVFSWGKLQRDLLLEIPTAPLAPGNIIHVFPAVRTNNSLHRNLQHHPATPALHRIIRIRLTAIVAIVSHRFQNLL